MKNKKKLISILSFVIIFLVGWIAWGNSALIVNEEGHCKVEMEKCDK